MNLSGLLADLHEELHQRLERSRRAFSHPTSKGDASESVWLELLNSYLPARYKASRAHVVDSQGAFSDCIDVVIYDRQYSPFILTFQNQTIIPAESVYAVFESKQSITADEVRYAQEKVASVRKLHRTSLPIPHAGGTYPPKPLIPIVGGILALESDWNPAMGASLTKVLAGGIADERLDMGCVASHGYFVFNRQSREHNIITQGKHATGFLFSLISELQFSGTVPMIDVQAYAQWLAK
jgi:hypothetical protein